MSAGIHLSSAEVEQLARLAHEANDIASPNDFRSWTRHSVRKLFPHEAVIAGLARRQSGQVRVEALLGAGFPMGFIDAVTRRRGSFVCPTLEAWFRQHRPQLFDPMHGAVGHAPAQASSEFQAYQLKNVAAHGVLSPTRDSATYFSFSQVPHTLTQRHGFLLELLAPHLHRAYLAAGAVTTDQFRPVAALVRLSASERAVLRALYLDESTKTIALTRGRSDNTVKHQIQSLLTKLAARDRAEAVTTAVCLGLLPDRRSGVARRATPNVIQGQKRPA